ncbi:hypothetical protein GF354_01100, partial [Candidatus Peregrinibacteria bacterium]|nr:hypothetical protein [Candidatus Peregrinibacteria bacterium]
MRNLLLSFLLFFTFSSLCFAEFPDVDENTDYYQSILYAQENGLVHGYNDGLFRPYRNITRAEFTKVIIEAVFSNEEINSCDTSTNRAEMVRMMYLLRENIEGGEYKILLYDRLWDYDPELVDLGWGYVKYG